MGCPAHTFGDTVPSGRTEAAQDNHADLSDGNKHGVAARESGGRVGFILKV
jgi:hypothetical protein